MARIVTTHTRYKPPPRKTKPVALDMPAVATIRSAEASGVAAKDDAPAATDTRKPAIVTARKLHARWHIEAPDLTEDEINRRADAAEALFRKIAPGPAKQSPEVTPQRQLRDDGTDPLPTSAEVSRGLSSEKFIALQVSPRANQSRSRSR